MTRIVCNDDSSCNEMCGKDEAVRTLIAAYFIDAPLVTIERTENPEVFRMKTPSRTIMVDRNFTKVL